MTALREVILAEMAAGSVLLTTATPGSRAVLTVSQAVRGSSSPNAAKPCKAGRPGNLATVRIEIIWCRDPSSRIGLAATVSRSRGYYPQATRHPLHAEWDPEVPLPSLSERS